MANKRIYEKKESKRLISFATSLVLKLSQSYFYDQRYFYAKASVTLNLCGFQWRIQIFRQGGGGGPSGLSLV